MTRRTLGSDGPSVRAVGLGGMPMSLRGRPAEAESVEVIHAALDAGVDFIDTADAYCIDHTEIGHNERLIARALREWSGSADVRVATKGGLERPNGSWARNGRPEHLRSACEASLEALGVDAIDLYQLHAPDPAVPFVQSVGVLSELKTAGKVRRVGLSNVSAEQIEQARAIVDIASVQNRCNVFDRRAFDDGVLATCERHGIAFLPWAPVGGGRRKGTVGGHPVLQRVGERHGASPFQVALAWLLAKSPVMIAIPGASKVRNAVSSAAAAELVLTEADLAEIDAIG